MAFKYGGTISEQVLSDRNNTFAILLDLVGQEKKILEIGCATGYMTAILQQRGNQVWGVEIDPLAAEKARPFAEEIWVGNLDKDADRAQIKGTFDVILITDVLEHLVFPADLLKFLTSHLADGGQLIVSVPNVAHWSIRRNLLRGRWDLTETGLMDRTHLYWFTRQTGRELLTQAGYQIIDQRASYVFPAHNRLNWGQKFVQPLQKSGFNFWPSLFAIQNIYVAKKAS